MKTRFPFIGFSEFAAETSTSAQQPAAMLSPLESHVAQSLG